MSTKHRAGRPDLPRGSDLADAERGLAGQQARSQHAQQGYELLAARFAEATDLQDLGVRYVRFATGHPAHFQVMFRPELLRTDAPELRAARRRTRTQLREAVGALGGDEEASGAGVMAAWAVAHGFASLLLTHNLDETLAGRDPEAVFRSLAQVMFQRSGPGA
ncbi:TetR-like C-terminal domain-containing protein [Streptomyces sp. NPDC059828]|uniref:TetR-like C-terminal domain-containing protein n=1 Tax=Streptomyces sp. NPDC059828 TaxID=3346965 RepID=UPI003646C9C1